MLQQLAVVVEGGVKTPSAHEPRCRVFGEVDQEGREAARRRDELESTCLGSSVGDGEGCKRLEIGR